MKRLRLTLSLKEDILEVMELSEEEVTLGRDPANKLILGDPKVSAHHAVITRGREGYIIKDLGSTNGTLFQGKKISQKEINDNDQFMIGPYTLTFHYLEPEEETKEDRTVFLSDVLDTPGDKTKFLDKEPPPVLIGVTEPVKGTVFEISKDRMVIGRVENQDIHIPDQSVSKQHAQIIKEDRNYIIEDLNSTNHTYVNGRRIDRFVLSPGDVIDIGAVKLKFQRGTDTDSALDKTGTHFTKRKRSFKLIYAICGILILISIFALLIRGGSNKRAKEEASINVQPQDAKIELINKHLTLAKEEEIRKNYERALYEANLVLGLDPENKEAKDIQGRAKIELEKIRKKKEKEIEEKKKREERIKSLLIEVKSNQQNAETLFSSGNYTESYNAIEKAIASLDEVLKLSPDNLEAKTLKEELVQRQKEIKEKRDEISNTLVRGKEYYKKGKYLKAIKYLSKALALVDKESAEGKKIRVMIRKAKLNLKKQADPYYSKGVELLEEGDLTSARKAFKKAVRICPWHSKAQKYLKECNRKLTEEAKDLYREGLVAAEQFNNIEEAIEKWQRVLELLDDPSHPYYKKAKRKIELYK